MQIPLELLAIVAAATVVVATDGHAGERESMTQLREMLLTGVCVVRSCTHQRWYPPIHSGYAVAARGESTPEDDPR